MKGILLLILKYFLKFDKSIVLEQWIKIKSMEGNQKCPKNDKYSWIAIARVVTAFSDTPPSEAAVIHCLQVLLVVK